MEASEKASPIPEAAKQPSPAGAAAMALSLLYALYALYVKLFLGQTPRGFTALVLLVIFTFGVLLFFLGIIGEYVGRVYEETKARPPYVVGRRIGPRLAEGELATPAVPSRSHEPAPAQPTLARTDPAGGAKR